MRKKILFTLLAVAVFYVAVDYMVQRWVLYPSFVKLENQQAIRNLERCGRALEREAEHLNQICFDWSAWDDTGLFVEGRKSDYIQQNMTDEMFQQPKLNMFCFLDAQNKYVWGKCVKFAEGKQIVQMDIKEFSAEVLPQESFLLGHRKPEDSIAGLMVTEAGPMLVASRPITNNKNELPIRGTVIVGRLINDETMALLAEQTQVDFEWWSLSSEKSRQVLQPYLGRLTKENPIFLERPAGQDLVAVCKIIPGLNTKQAVLIKAITKQEITVEGQAAIRFALASLLISGGIVLISLWILLEAVVLYPLGRLHQHTLHVAQTGDLTSQVHFRGKNEISSLAESFNQMVNRLYQERTKQMEQFHLTETSRILRTLRGWFQSLQKKTESIDQQVQDMSLECLKKAREELVDPNLSDARKEELVLLMDMTRQSLVETMGSLVCEFQDVDRSMGQMERNLAHSGMERPAEAL